MDAPVTEVIAVTDKAARRIAALALKEGRALPVLRVRVTAGGCSGFTYELSFADGPDDDDAVIEAADGVRVLVDPKSSPDRSRLHARVQRRAPGWRAQDDQPAGDPRVRLRRLLLDLGSIQARSRLDPGSIQARSRPDPGVYPGSSETRRSLRTRRPASRP